MTRPKPPRDPWPWLYWGLFFIVVPLVALWMAHRPAPQVSLPVPALDLPPYHIITAGDLMTASIPARQVAEVTARTAQDLVGHYTLQPAPAGKPLRRDQVVAVPDPALITNTLAVAIPADSTTTLGGALRAGDVVAVAVVPTENATSPVKLLDAVLVLDVRQTQEGEIIVLAIPAARWTEYLAKTQNATVVLALRVE